MKKHLPRSCSEWLRLLIGGAAAGLVYLAVALPTGLSGAVSRIELPVIGSLCGVLCGCIFLVVNALLLEATVRRIASAEAVPACIGSAMLAGTCWQVGCWRSDSRFLTRSRSSSCWFRRKSPIWSVRWPALGWSPDGYYDFADWKPGFWFWLLLIYCCKKEVL